MNNVAFIKDKIKNTEVLFFDLDGTLIGTEPLYCRFWKEACLFYGFELSDEQVLTLRSRDHQSTMEFLTKISGGTLDYSLTRAKRIELMDEYLKTHPIQIKEGAIEFLTLLKQQNKSFSQSLFFFTSNIKHKIALYTCVSCSLTFFSIISKNC